MYAHICRKMPGIYAGEIHVITIKIC